MKSIGIFYGSTTGDCETIAGKIAAKLNVDTAYVKNISDLNSAAVSEYDVLLFGSSTWGYGDLQDDWESAISLVESLNLSGKTVAIFGCGDSSSYSDTFCNAIGLIYDALTKTNANIVGAVSTDGYSFSSSDAVREGKFVGLALDEVNESGKTDARIDAWIEEIKSEIA